MDEDHPLNGTTPYAVSKSAADQLILVTLNCLILMPLFYGLLIIMGRGKMKNLTQELFPLQ
jgi:hypothetical protein